MWVYAHPGFVVQLEIRPTLGCCETGRTCSFQLSWCCATECTCLCNSCLEERARDEQPRSSKLQSCQMTKTNGSSVPPYAHAKVLASTPTVSNFPVYKFSSFQPKHEPLFFSIDTEKIKMKKNTSTPPNLKSKRLECLLLDAVECGWGALLIADKTTKKCASRIKIFFNGNMATRLFSPCWQNSPMIRCPGTTTTNRD